MGFEAVYRRFCDPIYRFLCHLSQAPERAKDLHQETWVKVARALADGARLPEGDAALRPWLYTVARNVFYDDARGRARSQAREAAVAAPDAGDGADPAALVDSRRRLRALADALASLPEASREILLLVAVEGLEPQEAAQVLGLKPDAARQRLLRARTQLAEALDRAPSPAQTGVAP